MKKKFFLSALVSGLALVFLVTTLVPTRVSAQQQLDTVGCTGLLKSYIKLGVLNNPFEVIKLQLFLNVFQGEKLMLTGVYDPMTYAAVLRFQEKYRESILDPWSAGLAPTGYVYLTTTRLVNKMVCPSLNLPMPDLQ